MTLATASARVAELEAALTEKTATADKAASRWKEAESKSDELWRKIGDLQKELTSSRDQAVENARAQRQAAQITLTRAVEEASKKLVSVQDQVVRTERERQDLEEQRNTLRDRVAELEKDLAGARDELDRVRQQAIAAALEPDPHTQATLAAAQSELERARSDLDRVAADAREAHEHRAAALEELERARVALEQSASDLEQASSSGADAQDARSRIAGELEGARAELGRARDELQAAATAGAVAQGERDAIAAELDQVRVELGDLRASLDRESEVAAERERRSAAAQEERDRALRELDGVRAELERARDQAATGIADLRRRAEERAADAARLAELDEVLTALDEGLRAEEDRLAGVEDRLRAVEPPRVDDSRLAAREERIRALSVELGERDADLAMLSGTVDSAKKKVAELLGLIRHAREQILDTPPPDATALLEQLVKDAVKVAQAR